MRLRWVSAWRTVLGLRVRYPASQRSAHSPTVVLASRGAMCVPVTILLVCSSSQRCPSTFAAEVARLCATPVAEDQWFRFLDTYVSRHDPAGIPLKGRALTIADRKRDTL